MPEQQLLGLYSAVVTPQMGVIAVACWAILQALHRVIPTARQNRVWWYLLPLMPSVVGVVLAMLPMAAADSATWGDRVLLGIIAGAFASVGRKILKRRIEELAGERDGA